jgi:hypothetical protein
MTPVNRLRTLFWIPILACSLAFVVWSDLARQKRVEFISNFSAKEVRTDAGAASGYADGKRWLIVPEHNNPTYQWIQETQQMVAGGEWRVRSVDTENAPYGRKVDSPSPYRWWLVFLAWAGHLVSGKTVALCIERAALYADPLLHLIFLCLGTVFVARRFGALAGAAYAVGTAALFPIAAAFLPGVANDFGMGQGMVLCSVLLLVEGSADLSKAPAWYGLAGFAGGIGLWLNASIQAPIIAGAALGGVLAGILEEPKDGAESAVSRRAWKSWALAGSVTSLAGYLAEYFPGHMDLQLRVNCPLYGVAWLGLGELAWRIPAIVSWTHGRERGRAALGAALPLAAVASLPIAILWARQGSFLTDDLLSTKLTNLPGGLDEPSLLSWIRGGGPKGALLAALLPALFLPLSLRVMLARGNPAHLRRSVAIALVPALVALTLAAIRIRWWNTFDAVIIPLVVVAAFQGPGAAGRWSWAAILAVSCALGLSQLVPSGFGGSGVVRLTRAEVEGLYERDLAHWLSDHSAPGQRTVLCPPFRTSSLSFYGGLRGVGSQNWENKEGMAATSHIATAMRRDESEEVVRQRGVNFIVLPSWDTDLDELARLNLKYPESSFVYALHRLHGGGFPWLRPVPYEVPPVGGLDPQSVLILQVTDPSDPATAQSRIVEYLLEMRDVDEAVVASAELRNYPANIGAQVALAQLAKVRRDGASFDRVFRLILSEMSAGADRRLAWDRRVSLAVVLAIGGRADLSRAQVRRCIDEASEENLRSLTKESLFHLLILAKRSGVSLGDPGLQALSLKLLPESARERL